MPKPVNNYFKFSPQELLKYLFDTSDQATLERINENRNDDQLYKAFFELFDRTKSRLDFNKTLLDENYVPLKIEELDNLILRLFSGDLASEDPYLLINELKNSSSIFYHRLIDDLELSYKEQIVPSEVNVLSDDAILQMIINNVKPQSKFKKNIITIFSIEKQKIFITGVIRNYLPTFVKVPRYAIVFILFIGISTSAIYSYYQIEEYIFYAQFRYDNKEPYVPEVWRETSTPTVSEPDFKLLQRGIQISLNDYIKQDYLSTINSLKSLSHYAQALQARSNNSEISCLLRDYYFYLGISYFAAFRSKSLKIEDDIRKLYSRNSIQNLESALSYSNPNSCPLEQDREFYFLGLAFGFAGDFESANTNLQKIGSESYFYENSKKLINKWQNNY